MSEFDERWLSPGGIVPVDIPTTGILIREIQRLRASLRTDAEARIFCLEDTLRPFALWADSMYTLKDDAKVCGIYVRHFRDAAKVLAE